MSRRYIRPGVLVGHVLVLAAALTCLRLGWWQWGVAHASRGTVQNLGYALLWPVFAGSFIFMWLRFLHLEAVRDAEQAPPGVSGPNGDAEIGAGRGDGRAVAAVDPAPAADPRRTDSQTGATRAGSPGAERAGPERPPDGSDGGDAEAEPSAARSRPATGRRTRREAYVVSVATIGDADDDDPELAAYNRALAALAEQDRRRAD